MDHPMLAFSWELDWKWSIWETGWLPYGTQVSHVTSLPDMPQFWAQRLHTWISWFLLPFGILMLILNVIMVKEVITKKLEIYDDLGCKEMYRKKVSMLVRVRQ